MDDKILRERIVELAQTLKQSPSARGARASQTAYVSQVPPPSGNVEDLLDHIRLQAKYLLFDLEATRRENRYLRAMLERRPNSGEGADPP